MLRLLATNKRYFATCAIGSLVSGHILSEYVFTDDRLQAHAFSTPDHGLHAAHYPWSFHKWWAGYDHAAYTS